MPVLPLSVETFAPTVWQSSRLWRRTCRPTGDATKGEEEIDGILDALERGIVAPTTKERLLALEAEQEASQSVPADPSGGHAGLRQQQPPRPAAATLAGRRDGSSSGICVPQPGNMP